MGDHRASVKLSFDMHGVKKETEMWINYYPNECGIDSRIIEFFEECHMEAMEKWHEMSRKAEEKENKLADEQRDLREFRRLSKKYANSDFAKEN